MKDFARLMMQSFLAAVNAADPARVIAPHLPAPCAGRTVVIGAGKAAAAMARALENSWDGGKPLEGLVVTRYGHRAETRDIRVIEAGHPLPDEAGMTAAREILDLARSLRPPDRLIVLLSGGGSALLSLPVSGVSPADYQELTRRLLHSGMPIGQMNVLRKHLSLTQGGRLAAATAAQCLALIISDVAGDDLSAIASGPCSPDPSTYDDALSALVQWRVDAPPSVLRFLHAGRAGAHPETPKPQDPCFSRTETRIIASSGASLAAGAKVFEDAGICALILGDAIIGEASEVAASQSAMVRRIRQSGDPIRPPVVLISGGECTVTVRGQGRGGRCSEFLLHVFAELAGIPGVFGLACDTDGIDGTENNAGAMFSPESYRRAAAHGLDARTFLANNDAYSFFEAIGDLIDTGPTRTNVNDYRCILIT
jgi:hydroxypyruvate reductase